jgi:hypothetical protein
MLYANDLDSIRYSTFNASRPTQFLVHGFIDDGTVRWMKVNCVSIRFKVKIRFHYAIFIFRGSLKICSLTVITTSSLSTGEVVLFLCTGIYKETSYYFKIKNYNKCLLPFFIY